MKHIVALLIKYTAITAVLLIMLSIFQGISIPKVLLISLFLTGTAYLIGDLFILPKYGNAIAEIRCYITRDYRRKFFKLTSFHMIPTPFRHFYAFHIILPF